jgi:hypothetical protein
MRVFRSVTLSPAVTPRRRENGAAAGPRGPACLVCPPDCPIVRSACPSGITCRPSTLSGEPLAIKHGVRIRTGRGRSPRSGDRSAGRPQTGAGRHGQVWRAPRIPRPRDTPNATLSVARRADGAPHPSLSPSRRCQPGGHLGGLRSREGRRAGWPRATSRHGIAPGSRRAQACSSLAVSTDIDVPPCPGQRAHSTKCVLSNRIRWDQRDSSARVAFSPPRREHTSHGQRRGVHRWCPPPGRSNVDTLLTPGGSPSTQLPGTRHGGTWA